MSTYNLAQIVHDKWLQQSRNKMTCLYEANMDELIKAFMQIANYMYWLKGGPTSKGLDHYSLKLKVVAKCGDMKVFADAMNFQRQLTYTHENVLLRVPSCSIHET